MTSLKMGQDKPSADEAKHRAAMRELDDLLDLLKDKQCTDTDLSLVRYELYLLGQRLFHLGGPVLLRQTRDLYPDCSHLFASVWAALN